MRLVWFVVCLSLSVDLEDPYLHQFSGAVSPLSSVGRPSVRHPSSSIQNNDLVQRGGGLLLLWIIT